MATNLAPTGATRWMLEQVVAAGSLKVQLLDAAYEPTDDDDYLSDISAGDKVGSATAVVGSISVGTHSGRPCIITTTHTTVTTAPTARDVGGLAVSFDDGLGDRILAVMVRRADRTSIAVDTDGGDVIVRFPGHRILKG